MAKQEQRTEQIHIVVTPTEKEIIEATARKKGLKMSVYLRMLALNDAGAY